MRKKAATTPDEQTIATKRIKHLLASARDGNDLAFEELIRLHRSTVYGIAYSLLGSPDEAMDVSQDVFLRMFKSLNHLRAEKGLNAWLKKVTLHRCYDLLRKRMSWKKVTESHFIPGCMQESEDGMGIQAAEILKQGLDYLPPRERTALLLTGHQGYSSEEASQLMGCRPATVRVLAHKARQRIRTLLFPEDIVGSEL